MVNFFHREQVCFARGASQDLLLLVVAVPLRYFQSQELYKLGKDGSM